MTGQRSPEALAHYRITGHYVCFPFCGQTTATRATDVRKKPGGRTAEALAHYRRTGHYVCTPHCGR